MAVDAYKIGVTIAMTSNASAVLGALGKDLLGLSNAAKALESQLGLVKVAALGAMGALAGTAVLKGMWSLVDAGRELVHQQALMKSAGMTQIEIANATKEAWRVAGAVGTVSVAEAAKSIRELRMVFGDTHEAIANLETVTRAQAVMESLRGHGAGDQVFDMAKALEIKGVSMDVGHFERLVDAMVKASIASGGRVTGSDFLTAFKFGRTATQGWNDHFVGLILPTLIQELKASGGSGGTGGPGNALMSAFQAVVGGTMSNKAAEEFVKLGLVNKNAIITTSTGSVKGIRPGGVIGADLFQSDPYEWVQSVLMPALGRAKITTPEGIRNEIAHMFVNRTAQQIMTMFATQQMRFDKDAELIAGAEGVGAFGDLAKNDPTMKMKQFTEAWHNLMTALGVPLVDTAMNLLGKLTSVMQSMGQWAAAHPTLVGDIEKVVAAIGVGLVVGGTATLIGALVMLGGPVVAVTGAIAALSAAIVLFQDDIKNFLAWINPWSGGAMTPSPPRNPAADIKAGLGGGNVNLQGTVTFDGEPVGRFIARRLSDGMDRPYGSGAPDYRVSGYHAGSGVLP